MAVIAAARTPVIDRVAPLELRIFRAINRLPDAAYGVLWPVMQSGSLAAVPVAMVIARLSRGRISPLSMAVGGSSAYVLAKLVKRSSGRPRPAAIVGSVRIRGGEQAGGGLPSGHAAVSAALATAAFDRLRGGERLVGIALATGAAVGRVYVGAHLPLDVAVGAALGIGIGGLARGTGPGDRSAPSTWRDT